MITPNDNINDNTLNVIIFEGLDVIIFKCRGCYHFSWCQCCHFLTGCYHFGVLDVIILSVEDVIIFHGALGIIFL